MFLDLDGAYQKACQEGSKKVFLARMNLVGFHEAGKTSLAKRLMGKNFDADVKSTEGIALHYIKSTCKRNKLTGKQWIEVDIKADDLNKEVIENMKRFVDSSEEQQPDETNNRSNDKENVKVTNCFQRVFNCCSQKKAHDVVKPEVPVFHMSAHFKELALTNFETLSDTELEDNVPFTLRLWDLGGQNDFLTTHHLFLDVEATTVIVMDITKDFSERFQSTNKDLQLKRSNPSSPEEVMHYWLNSFFVEANEKEKKTSKAVGLKIFIVLTHIDNFDTEIEKQEQINRYKEQIMNSLRKKSYACLITEDKIFAVDNKTGKDESFHCLKEHLLNSFSQQESWNKTMPVKWLRLQADIFEKKEEGKNYMSSSSLEELGRSVGMVDAEIESFLDMHNEVGTFLHFDEAPKESGPQMFHLDDSIKLKDIIITEPQWLVDMCKEVITHPEFLFKRKRKLGPDERLKLHTLEELQKGYVTQDSLNKLWGSGKAAAFLTKLMVIFDIFIPLADSKKSGQQYLIPCMLPVDNENHDATVQEERVLLYNGVHRASCGNWFHLGKFSTLLATIIRTNTWKLSSSPFPSYDRVTFVSMENVHLQLTLEENPKPNPNFRAIIYCSPPRVRDKTLQKTLKQTLEQTRRLLSDTTEQINIQCEEELKTFCPYYGLQEDGLKLVLTTKQMDQLKCPCHSMKLTRAEYIRFKETYVCEFTNC